MKLISSCKLGFALLGLIGALSSVNVARASAYTINLDTADPDCDLDYVPHQPRPMRIRIALSNSFGFGGQNGAIVLKRWEEADA